MPFLFISLFIGLSILYPQLMRWTAIAPILAFTFGGFFWAIGGMVGLASFSVNSFLLYFAITYTVVIFLTRDK
jgi:hypothetical protein